MLVVSHPDALVVLRAGEVQVVPHDAAGLVDHGLAADPHARRRRREQVRGHLRHAGVGGHDGSRVRGSEDHIGPRGGRV